MRLAKASDPLADRISDVLTDFTEWLDAYSETSWDYQSFFAGPVGGRAKALYYRHRLIGTAAVAPMIFCEAFVPSARRLFPHRIRFPIVDAHYAMGFVFLYEATGDFSQLENAVHFLTELKKSRCLQFKEYCWGYPFDWVWCRGTIKRQTPLITSTPYAYEAFLQVYQILERISDFRPLSSPTAVLRPQTSVLWICLMNTSKSPSRLRDTRLLISRTSGHQKRQAVVPTRFLMKVELSTPLLTAPFS
jgi:hypothetical protein